jgi:hypothetical protein
MRRSIRAPLGWVVIGFLASCAGASPSADAPRDEATRAVEDDTSDHTPSASEVRSAMREEGEEACAAACEHVASCTGAAAPAECESECHRDLAQPSGAPALHYAGCVQALSCEEIEEAVSPRDSTTAGMGGIRRCFSAALRMSR